MFHYYLDEFGQSSNEPSKFDSLCADKALEFGVL